MTDVSQRSERILIVDDELGNVLVLKQLLELAGYRELRFTTDSTEVEGIFTEFLPDLVLLDLHMPVLDGFAVMRLLAGLIDPGDYVPIVVLTADVTQQSKRAALQGGARDFLTKPLDHAEVLSRVGNLLDTRRLQVQLRRQNASLERLVEERTRDLDAARLESLRRLALAAEYRDDDTRRHTERVGALAALLAERVGPPAEFVETIRYAAPLHDIGKLGIPDAILLKPGRLTEGEHAQMQTHTTIGAAILAGGTFPVLQVGEIIALTHHERWDGTGYPNRTAAEAIPLEGRIVAVADVFDALTHERPYKQAWSLEEAFEGIVAASGTQFDPDVVMALEARHASHHLQPFTATTADPARSPEPAPRAAGLAA
jgi:putative two-component system response regulator